MRIGCTSADGVLIEALQPQTTTNTSNPRFRLAPGRGDGQSRFYLYGNETDYLSNPGIDHNNTHYNAIKAAPGFVTDYAWITGKSPAIKQQDNNFFGLYIEENIKINSKSRGRNFISGDIYMDTGSIDVDEGHIWSKSYIQGNDLLWNDELKSSVPKVGYANGGWYYVNGINSISDNSVWKHLDLLWKIVNAIGNEMYYGLKDDVVAEANKLYVTKDTYNVHTHNFSVTKTVDFNLGGKEIYGSDLTAYIVNSNSALERIDVDHVVIKNGYSISKEETFTGTSGLPNQTANTNEWPNPQA